jgi:acetyltransferase-like isoleucine patch superfamily enzyme
MEHLEDKTIKIAETAKIGRNCILGHNVVILDNVQIGERAYIGNNVVIHRGTKIGHNIYIEDGAILGRIPRSGVASARKVGEVKPLEIGNNCVIGAHSIIYAGTKIGDDTMVGDLASIRENNIIGNRVIVGRLVMIEPNTKIGDNVKIQTGTHITGDAVIENDVFFGDEVSTSNDNSMGRAKIKVYKGPYIKRGARIGSNSTLLPGVVIGEEAVVAAGSVVTHDVPDRKVVMGVPARVVRDVPEDEIIIKK